jgi:hypothetical protein
MVPSTRCSCISTDRGHLHVCCVLAAAASLHHCRCRIVEALIRQDTGGMIAAAGPLTIVSTASSCRPLLSPLFFDCTAGTPCRPNVTDQLRHPTHNTDDKQEHRRSRKRTDWWLCLYIQTCTCIYSAKPLQQACGCTSSRSFLLPAPACAPDAHHASGVEHRCSDIQCCVTPTHII